MAGERSERSTPISLQRVIFFIKYLKKEFLYESELKIARRGYTSGDAEIKQDICDIEQATVSIVFKYRCTIVLNKEKNGGNDGIADLKC